MIFLGTFMKYSFFAILGLLGLTVCGCKNNNQENDVVSQRYVHKYGYAISQDDWEARNYPGQEVVTLRNGVTATTTYENGIQHGPTTLTYPNSQTVEHYYLYNLGNMILLFVIHHKPGVHYIYLSYQLK